MTVTTELELTEIALERLALLGCGGTDIEWTFSAAGLRRTLEAAMRYGAQIEVRALAGGGVTGWVLVSERLPPEDVLVLVYTPDRGDGERMCFDWIDDGSWYEHNDHFDHYMAVTGGKGCLDDGTPCTGPSETAPYTHWWEILPPPPMDSPQEKA